MENSDNNKKESQRQRQDRESAQTRPDNSLYNFPVKKEKQLTPEPQCAFAVELFVSCCMDMYA